MHDHQRRRPLNDWFALWRGAMGMAETGLRMIEVGQASAEVIASHCQTMAEAAGDPLGADHAELGRMMPEKVDALGRASLSLWADWAALHADAQAGMIEAMRRAASGRGLDPGHGARMMRMTERSMTAGGRALAPVHAKVTGNARRLRGKPKPA